MKIGLDFDGVIFDVQPLKCKIARELYGVDILPELFKREFIINKKILTPKKYRHLQKVVYESKRGLDAVPVEGALEFIQRLQQESHELRIVTSRYENSLLIAKELLKRDKLDIEIISIHEGNKAKACRGLDVFLEDDLDKLFPLWGVVLNRYLLSRDYNFHIRVPPHIAKRVESWEDFYFEISEKLSTKYNNPY